MVFFLAIFVIQLVTRLFFFLGCFASVVVAVAVSVVAAGASAVVVVAVVAADVDGE